MQMVSWRYILAPLAMLPLSDKSLSEKGDIPSILKEAVPFLRKAPIESKEARRDARTEIQASMSLDLIQNNEVKMPFAASGCVIMVSS
jgi:hypothetical protein